MKRIVLIFIIIIIVLLIAGIVFFFNTFGNRQYDLKNISEKQKENIITILNCNEISNEIELIEMQVPKVYKDIYYEIYFKTNNKSIKDYILKNENDLYGIDLKELNDNNYCCNIYRKDDKSIDILEAIINKDN